MLFQPLILCSLEQALASYEPIEGRISYLAGAMISTNFQETMFNNQDTRSKLGRSQSFAVLFQGLGDLNEKSSLMAEITLGTHKFYKETKTTLDEFNLEAITFDLGYRRRIGGDFWWSAQLGSFYPWRVTQKVDATMTTEYPDSDFTSIYSLILGVQYESTINNAPVSYDLRIRKYMNGQLDDHAALSFSIGWRFGLD